MAYSSSAFNNTKDVFTANTSKDNTIWTTDGANIIRSTYMQIRSGSTTSSNISIRTNSNIPENFPCPSTSYVDKVPTVLFCSYYCKNEVSLELAKSIYKSVMNSYEIPSIVFPVLKSDNRGGGYVTPTSDFSLGYYFFARSFWKRGVTLPARLDPTKTYTEQNPPISFTFGDVTYVNYDNDIMIPELYGGLTVPSAIGNPLNTSIFATGGIENRVKLSPDSFTAFSMLNGRTYRLVYYVQLLASRFYNDGSSYSDSGDCIGIIDVSFNSVNDFAAICVYASRGGAKGPGYSDYPNINKNLTSPGSLVQSDPWTNYFDITTAKKFAYYPSETPPQAQGTVNLGGGGTAGDITDISGGDNYNGGTQPNTTTVITQTGAGTSNLPKDTISAPNIVNQSYGTSFNIYEVTTPSTFLSALQTDSIWKSFTDMFRGGKPIDSVVNIYNTTISPPSKGKASQLFVGGHELISEYSSGTIGANTLPRFQKIGTYTLYSDFFNPYNSFYDQMGDYYIHVPYIGTKRLDAAVYSRGRGITVDGSTESTKYAQLNIYMDFLTGDLFAYTTMDGFVIDQWTGNAASPIPLRREQDGGMTATSSLTASGAAIGASIGTIVPGIGNVLGSTLGGAIGAGAGIGAASSGAFKSVQADKNIQGNIGFMDTKDIYLTGYLPRFAVPYGYGTMNGYLLNATKYVHNTQGYSKMNSIIYSGSGIPSDVQEDINEVLTTKFIW